MERAISSASDTLAAVVQRHLVLKQASVILGGDHFIMTENEQRARDILTREDILVRGVSVVGLIAMFLLILLVVNP